MRLTDEQRALRESVRELLRRHRPDVRDPMGSPALLDSDPGPDPGDRPDPGHRPDPLRRPDPGHRPDPGYDLALWRRLGEMGVAGLAVPERFGGAGAGPVETSVVAEELGRILAPAPLIGSAVLATQVILGCGDTDAGQRLLPGLSAGSLIAALAWTGPGGGWDPAEAAFAAAEQPGEGWTLNGEAHHVLDGDSADVLIAAARTPRGIGLFEVDPDQPGVTRHAVTTMDQTRRLAVVRLSSASGRPLGPGPPHGRAAPLGPGPPHGRAAPPGPATAPDPVTAPSPVTASGPAALSAPEALARARDLTCIALSAEQVGAAARALELTVGYTRTRVQFGRPIASFQAIQHRLADLYVLVHSARALSYQAAGDAASGASGWPSRAAAAKAYCSEALMQVTVEMIQMHGAIGVTWEHEAHRYFKRAHGTAQLLGQPTAHIARIATAIIGA